MNWIKSFLIIISLVSFQITNGQDIHSSQMDLNDLKQIFLKNMTVNKIHFGEYLECIVIEVPFNFH